MATIAENLVKLNDIKETQKTELSKMFSYMDWNTVPYSMYSKYYKYRNLLDTCGELAVNAYNKTNSDINKDILYDYCCKRHDTEYFLDFTKIFPNVSGVTPTTVTLEEGQSGTYKFKTTRLKMKLLVDTASSIYSVHVTLHVKVGNVTNKRIFSQDLNKEINIDIDTKTEGLIIQMDISYIDGSSVGQVKRFSTATILQIPGYIASNDIELINFNFNSTDGYAPHKNALTKTQEISYGKASLNFALPKDFTLFACRNAYTSTAGYLVCKKTNSNVGEFFFEGATNSYSYENEIKIANTDKVVSYMTPTSYNDTPITYGDYIGTKESIFYIFGTSELQYSNSGALYSVALFNRTLTKEELTIVKDILNFEYLEKIK